MAVAALPDHLRQSLERCAAAGSLFSYAASGRSFRTAVERATDDLAERRFAVLLQLPAGDALIPDSLPATLREAVGQAGHGLVVWEEPGSGLGSLLRDLAEPVSLQVARALETRRYGPLAQPWAVNCASGSPFARSRARLAMSVLASALTDDPYWAEALARCFDLQVLIVDGNSPRVAGFAVPGGPLRIELPATAAPELLHVLDGLLVECADSLAAHRCARLLTCWRTELSYEGERLGVIAGLRDRVKRSTSRTSRRADEDVISRVKRARDIAYDNLDRIEQSLDLEGIGLDAAYLALNIDLDALELDEQFSATERELKAARRAASGLVARTFTAYIDPKRVDEITRKLVRGAQRAMDDDRQTIEKELDLIRGEVTARLQELKGMGVELPELELPPFKARPDFKAATKQVGAAEERVVRKGWLTDFRWVQGLLAGAQSMLLFVVIGLSGWATFALGEKLKVERGQMIMGFFVVLVGFMLLLRPRLARAQWEERKSEALEKLRSKLATGIESAIRDATSMRAKAVREYRRELRTSFDRFWFEVDERINARQQDRARKHASMENGATAALAIANERSAQLQTTLKLLTQAIAGMKDTGEALRRTVGVALERLAPVPAPAPAVDVAEPSTAATPPRDAAATMPDAPTLGDNDKGSAAAGASAPRARLTFLRPTFSGLKAEGR